MAILIYLIVFAAVLWINYLIAREFYFAANAKGYYASKYLWICFFLGVAGYMLVIALPDRNSIKNEASNDLPAL